VELGDDAKYAVKGEGIIAFHLNSGGLFDAHDVLYVPGLKKNLFSVSAMEDRGFVVTFQRGKILIHLEKATQIVQWSLGLEKALYTGCKASLFRILYMSLTIYVSCDIGG
jgi:hypothetical protein